MDLRKTGWGGGGGVGGVGFVWFKLGTSGKLM
jgi:hypothetical protein